MVFKMTVKGGETMKKLISIAMMLLLALSVTACAQKPMKVKCPACQHEFETPVQQ